MILLDVDERNKNGERGQHDGRLLFARGLWLQMSVLSVLSVPLHVSSITSWMSGSNGCLAQAVVTMFR